MTKLDPTGTALAYSTYLGGSGSGALLFGMSQQGTGIAVDAGGNAYVSRWTGRVTFPPHRALFSFQVRSPTAAS